MNDIPLEISGQASISFGPYATLVTVVVGVVLLLILAVILQKVLHKPDLIGLTREEIKSRWEELTQASSQGIMGAKISLIEADKLLDSALKSLRMPGETLGERLKAACYRYPELKKVWYAHKLRNQLVHEATFELSRSQAKSALRDYEHALKTLHVL